MPEVITPAPAQWDAFIKTQPHAHFLQLSGWGELKSAFGWQSAIVALTENSAIVGGAQLLFRPLPMRLGTLAYLPMGPYLRDTAYWPQLWQAIDQCARQHKAAFLKWEPGIRDDITPEQWGFKASPQTIQPPNTVMIDISGDDEAIMQRMNQGTRRKIRQGAKKGVTYYEGTSADIDAFNGIMQTTGDRKAFGIHDAEYYAMMVALFVPEHGTLILAEHEGDTLAGIIVLAVGGTAWYPHGASSNVKRNLMATYGVQWEAIQWAKKRGCTQYDMWGIPDEDETTLEAHFQERSEGLWGVYGFKRGWGGDVRRSIGAWDKVYNPVVYTAYKTALKLRE